MLAELRVVAVAFAIIPYVALTYNGIEDVPRLYGLVTETVSPLMQPLLPLVFIPALIMDPEFALTAANPPAVMF